MSMLVPAALLLVAAIALAVLALWNPLPRDVRHRLEAATKDMAVHTPPAGGRKTSSRRAADLLERLFALGLHRRWGVTVRLVTLLLLGLVAGSATWLVAHNLLGWPIWLTALLAAVAFWFAPNRVARSEQEKAERAFLDQFPDAIDMIVRVLRAGLPVNVAIRTVAREAASPINAIFAALAEQLEIGMAFDDALGISSKRIGVADYRFFAAAIALQRTTGGNLTATLEILADIIRKRHTVRLKVRSATAEERISSYVLATMPFLIFGALLIVSPSYLAPLIQDPRGNLILIAAIVMLLSGFLTLRNMMRSAVRM